MNILTSSAHFRQRVIKKSYKGDYDTDLDEENGLNTKRCSCKFLLQPEEVQLTGEIRVEEAAAELSTAT